VLLERRGVVLAYRTLHRFCAERCGFGPRAPTVPVADGEPGMECQLDFGYLGMLFDPGAGRRRKVHALILMTSISECAEWPGLMAPVVRAIEQIGKVRIEAQAGISQGPYAL
jgi:hypothetical protein